jgi:phenol hydroxylase P4 protein
MAVKALADYNFPAADRQENFGDDMLVNLFWDGNLFIDCPDAVRVPRAMKWGDFKTGVLDPWAAADPDYDPAAATDWRINDDPFEPDPDRSLEQLGIRHKQVVKFRV